jgi:hypothetical protein
MRGTLWCITMQIEFRKCFGENQMINMVALMFFASVLTFTASVQAIEMDGVSSELGIIDGYSTELSMIEAKEYHIFQLIKQEYKTTGKGRAEFYDALIIIATEQLVLMNKRLEIIKIIHNKHRNIEVKYREVLRNNNTLSNRLLGTRIISQSMRIHEKVLLEEMLVKSLNMKLRLYQTMKLRLGMDIGIESDSVDILSNVIDDILSGAKPFSVDNDININMPINQEK